jgi:hypothetical protein
LFIGTSSPKKLKASIPAIANINIKSTSNRTVKDADR